ncbi:MAG: aminotransferase class III-fold pyridoxal phosphate-dependent enzyme [bacterium]|nr:aminotransferase class III-fold pyridoxal phosphate-dependent enzyme [bacterium]
MAELIRHENARFHQARPRSAALVRRAGELMPSGVPMAWMRGLQHHEPVFVESGHGATFTDVDGHHYVDFNQADLSSTAGYATPEVVEAVSRQMRAGAQFLMPCEDAVAVAGDLAHRFDLAYWQFTLSASSAMTEALRLARLATGRDGILMFDGSYHGHIDETLADYSHDEPSTGSLGLPHDHGRHTTIVPYNDLEAVRRELAGNKIAALVVEPALTNVGLVLPLDGFLESLRALAESQGTLLVVDETHTHMFAWGGLARHAKLNPHIVVIGKNFAGGVPIGAYGFESHLAELMDRHLFDPFSDAGGLAVGGTLYGNALSFAAARACLDHVMTREAYAHTSELGDILARGIQRIIDDAKLGWKAQHICSRAGWLYHREEPRSGAEAARLADIPLTDSRRIFMANRGIWEATATAGPTVSFAMTRTDIDLYLEVARLWVDTLLAT